MSTLVAQERKDFRRSVTKKLRREGQIPAVVYGSDVDTRSIAVKNNELRKVLKEVGRNGIFSLSLGGQSKNVILRDYQVDKVSGDILHVDFLQVDKDTEIDTVVSVVTKGTSLGEKEGGVVKQFLYELNITATAINIPDEIEIDISDFELGHTVRVADIKEQYQNITINHEDEEPILSIDILKPETEDEEEEGSETETEAEVAEVQA